MARDRKRARQRRPRPSDAVPRPVREGAPAPSQNRPTDHRSTRADLPGALDHAGDVDEFDAALIRGAGGIPAEQQDRSLGEAEEETVGLEGEEQELLPADGGRGGRAGRGRDGEGSAEDAFGAPAAVPAPRPAQPVGNRVVAFLRASWAELQRVQWPDRRQVTQATAVVLGFVAVAGAYLGVADWAAQKIVNLIL